MMTYKNYTAAVTYEGDDNAFHGNVVGIRGCIHFTAKSVAGLKKEFSRSVEEYLTVCEENNIVPEKAFSGRISVRLDPELHAKASAASKEKHCSLNAFICEALKNAL